MYNKSKEMAPMTNVQVQRDGLTLRGVLEIPEGKDKYDMAILMHGFTGNCCCLIIFFC